MYTIQKFRLPTISLDTFFINNVAKIKANEFIDDRYLEIYNLIYKLVRERKLICPNANQDEEFLREDRLNEECYKVVHSLSLGLEFLTEREIRTKQFNIGINSFKQKLKSVQINYKDFFAGNVENYLNRNNKYFVVVEKTNFKKLFHAVKDDERLIISDWQVLKNQNLNKYVKPMTYEEQLEYEYLGELEAIRTALNDIVKNRITKHLTYVWSFLNKIKPFFSENKYPTKDDMENVVRFYQSEYYKNLPIIDIASKLMAHLLTSYHSKTLKPSDQMDIDFLSAYIPLTHLVICDASMKDSCHKLKFDKTYNTEIYSIKDSDKIIDYLKNL